jgi:hypothetical protein
MLSLCFVESIIFRSELVCQAYVLRKNRNRTEVDGRLKTGQKIDGLFHELNDRQVEYGIMESARRLNAGEVSTKWQSDQVKLRKLMRDIMGRLAIHANHDRRVLSELEVVGISTAGFAVQVLRLSQPAGYACLLQADESVRVPASMSQFPQLLFVLCIILKTKVCTRRA